MLSFSSAARSSLVLKRTVTASVARSLPEFSTFGSSQANCGSRLNFCA
jgi:hypothetical protein